MHLKQKWDTFLHQLGYLLISCDVASSENAIVTRKSNFRAKSPPPNMPKIIITIILFAGIQHLGVGEVLAVEVGLETAVEPPATAVGRGAGTTLGGLVIVPAPQTSCLSDPGVRGCRVPYPAFQLHTDLEYHEYVGLSIAAFQLFMRIQSSLVKQRRVWIVDAVHSSIRVQNHFGIFTHHFRSMLIKIQMWFFYRISYPAIEIPLGNINLEKFCIDIQK